MNCLHEKSRVFEIENKATKPLGARVLSLGRQVRAGLTDPFSAVIDRRCTAQPVVAGPSESSLVAPSPTKKSDEGRAAFTALRRGKED
jgi:hypothetical protein